MDNGGAQETRSLEYTPSWSVATVLTVFVVISFIVERCIHRLGHLLHKTKQRPLYEALERMKEELMLLGFISLLLAATANLVYQICIKSSYYESTFSPCKAPSEKLAVGRELLPSLVIEGSTRRHLGSVGNKNSCKTGEEPFVSSEGLEQLHRFIFVMAVTHVFYSCIIMLLAFFKVHGWRRWELEAQADTHDSLAEITRALTMKRQSTFVMHHTSGPWSSNRLLIWMVCFFRQFGQSVARTDYLTLRMGFITNHNLGKKFDFHRYMVHSMEDEFKEIVGISAPLWGFVVTFMLLNIDGSNLYFWISFIPFIMVLIVGAKLQHIIATLALENAGLTGHFVMVHVKPRNELFWFNKPELLLWLIHFVLFQNAFELATFLWFWWQFGYNSCFLAKHKLVYIRLFLGFAGQFLCSYSTLPLYSLVTQMGTNYKVALIPAKIRESIHGWRMTAKKKAKHSGTSNGGDAIILHSEDNASRSEGIYDVEVPPSTGLEMQVNSETMPDNEFLGQFSTRVQRAASSIYPDNTMGTNVNLDDGFPRSISYPVYQRLP